MFGILFPQRYGPVPRTFIPKRYLSGDSLKQFFLAAVVGMGEFFQIFPTFFPLTLQLLNLFKIDSHHVPVRLRHKTAQGGDQCVRAMLVDRTFVYFF